MDATETMKRMLDHGLYAVGQEVTAAMKGAGFTDRQIKKARQELQIQCKQISPKDNKLPDGLSPIEPGEAARLRNLYRQGVVLWRLPGHMMNHAPQLHYPTGNVSVGREHWQNREYRRAF